MQFLITFLEGIISFISPCMLPLLPVYISYFAGNADKKQKTILRAFAFVLGFTAVFTLLGFLSGTLGMLLNKYQTVINIICGIFVILFGLSYLEVIRIPIFKGISKQTNVTGVLSAFLFGIIYSVSLTPCVGAFLGSALMLAASEAGAAKGAGLLLLYSLGLAVPFMISALLIEKLNTAFAFIKHHYKVINTVCGIFLIVIGVLMATGVFEKLMHFFS